MKTLYKLLLLLLALAMVFSIASCGEDGGDTSTDGDGGGDTVTPPDNGNDDPENLALIENGKANFKIVIASGADAAVRKAVEGFISDLQDIGVDIGKSVNDTSVADVSDCEIIVGTGVKNRDAKYVLNPKDYGDDGYIIKIVDNKVLIGGGNVEQTRTAFDYFVKNVVKLSGKVKELNEFKLERTYEKLKETKYLIESVEIAGVDLSEYVLATDLKMSDHPNIQSFRNELYSATGYWLDSVAEDAVPEGKHAFCVKLVEDAGSTGFRAYVDADKNFIVECAYANATDVAFSHLVDSVIFNKLGNVTISKSFEKTYPVNVVTYSQFGAKGDGVTDDFEAMYNAHTFANQCGQKVMGDGPTYRYFIHEFSKTIPVQTDVDFNGATIYIDDRGSGVYKYRSLHLFTFLPSHEVKSYGVTEIQEMSGGAPVLTTDTEIPWLAPYLESSSFIYMYNKHQDYIRHGGNSGYAMNRRDVFVIHPDGKLDESTPLYFDFAEGERLMNDGIRLEYYHTYNIEYLEIYRVDETPITMENGYFEREACETVIETKYENKYHAYARALGIQRSNVTVTNIQHKLLSEPYLPTSGFGWYDNNFNSIRQSYPYYGFLAFKYCYNSQAIDVDLWAHTTYYEVKTTNPDPVPMGSYDLTIGDSCNISLYGLTNGQDICDSQYWGIMASYGAKNMRFENCRLNRFDAHDGFWNAELIDCDFGFAINVIGGGDLYIENCVKHVGTAYINLRSDYGATFNGDITIIDGVLVGNKAYRGADNPERGKLYDSNTELQIINSGYITKYQGEYIQGDAGAAPYLKWDFGYTCYMPQNIIIDNFRVENEKVKVVLYNSIADEAFIKPNNFVQENDWMGKKIKLVDGTYRDMTENDVYYNQYQITKSVTYRNMTPFPPCGNNALFMYRHIESVTTVE